MNLLSFFKLLLPLTIVFTLNGKVIEGFSEYRFSDNESIILAKKRCKELAKRDMVEKFATYIASETTIEYGVVEKDDIVARSMGIVRDLKILDERIDRVNSVIYYKLQGDIDEKEVMKFLKESNGKSVTSSKIKDFILSAIKAEKDLRIGDALRYYYWSLLLLKNDPKLNSKMKYEELDKRLLSIVLPERIKNIFSSLDYRVEEINRDKNGKTIVLSITYKNTPVSGIDFKYYTGDGWSSLVKARNGLASAELYGVAANTIKKLSISTEYKYENRIKFDPDVKRGLEKGSHIPFSMGKFKVKLAQKKVKKEVKAKPVSTIKSPKIEKDITAINPDPHIAVVKKVVKALKNRRYNNIRNLFTPSGFENFSDLLLYGNGKPLLNNAELKSITIGKGTKGEYTVVRSLPMSFSFPKSGSRFIEKVNFIFSSEEKNRIDAISFSLSDVAIKDIMKKPERFGTKEGKYQIVQFMEYYKTAYSLKDIDYIESIFADNALIIVGKILKEGSDDMSEMYGRVGNDQVKYIKMSKSNYISHLKKVFDSNEFVNISFEENSVKKVNGKKVYGIQIKQNYYSQNYSDKGYLFLMMDLNNVSEPKIYVRSWQPQKNEDGSIMGLEDFRMGG
ncbi:MAG: hypothetical protein CSA15_06385 [Candidatus Delongbacteria bacterium]|nr:MAG: hypothetical protein CSA15_06385 [Candidatus Delongbacteria bacterium]